MKNTRESSTLEGLLIRQIESLERLSISSNTSIELMVEMRDALLQSNKKLEELNDELETTKSELVRSQKRTELAISRLHQKLESRIAIPIRMEVSEFLHRHQISSIDTVRALKKDRISLARYGDGEIRCLTPYHSGATFQRPSPRLAEKLQKVISYHGYSNQRLLVCLPEVLEGNKYWDNSWSTLWLYMKNHLNHKVKYGSTTVSRAPFFSSYGKDAVDGWRDVFSNEDVWVLTGEGSRFDLVEELFADVRSVNYLYTAPTNAFTSYDEYLEKIRATVPKDALCVLSIGPTATVLAADLSNLGYWAIDVGHISGCYNEVFNGAPKPEHTPMVRSNAEEDRSQDDI